MLMVSGCLMDSLQVMCLVMCWMECLEQDMVGCLEFLICLNEMYVVELQMVEQIGVMLVIIVYIIEVFVESKLVIWVWYFDEEEMVFICQYYFDWLQEWFVLVVKLYQVCWEGVVLDLVLGQVLVWVWFELFQFYVGIWLQMLQKFCWVMEQELYLMKGIWMMLVVLSWLQQVIGFLMWQVQGFVVG